MKIWIDGDACPSKIKDILFKAAERTQTEAIIVANHYFKIPPSAFIKRITVAQGFDAADKYIIDNVTANDLVITADIPLAHDVVMANAIALSPKGKIFTESNIKQALAMRDFYTSLRDSGLHQSSEDKLNTNDLHSFANHLDKILAKNK